MKNKKLLKKILPGIKKNVSLAAHTAFKIGGPAKYFFIAKTKKDLIRALKTAKNLKLPFFILGGGSNVLAGDRGYRGIIINFQFPPPGSPLEAGSRRSGTTFNFQKNKIITSAGTKLSSLVNASAKKGLTGLEWAAGIPGTVGGAIYGNAGWPSNKKNISSVIESIEALDIRNSPKIKKFKPRECRFDYRESVFKGNKNLIILSAVLKLKKGDKKTIKKKIAEIIKARREKIPAGFSAGSVFKNPPGFHAGALIEKCGLKGKRIGNALISEKHANFIINLGDARSKDVIKLIDIAKQEVKRKFGVVLEEEIQYLK